MPVMLNYEPGSYRDRDGRVFYPETGGVCRALSAHALAEWDAVRRSHFFQRAVASGDVVHTEQITEAETILEHMPTVGPEC